MDVVLLAVGAKPGVDAARLRGALSAAGAGVTSRTVPDAERVGLDDVLDELAGRRLVIAASAADLARVLRRMMRRGELAHIETAVLPVEPVPFLARNGVDTDLESAALVAAGRPCRAVGVLKDDSGNLVVDHAVVRPWHGRRVWIRAYVEDERLCDGEVTALRVERGRAGGLRASATGPGRLWLGRTRTVEGRAIQLACGDAAISSDGAGRDQPRRKRIWWDEPDQWRLACGPP